jgi:hypothetical protein
MRPPSSFETLPGSRPGSLLRTRACDYPCGFHSRARFCASAS